ncbi:hypothetical protein GCM10023403_10250 [Pseudonocardia benzenivorans]|uniref:hypothetical protein n=1 Tax=Pseudonocardia benzenivorans TaxID=228005 RepID=UPI0031F78E0C
MTTVLNPPTHRLVCDRCGAVRWLTLVDGEQLCSACAPADHPPAHPAPLAPQRSVIGCGCCDQVVPLSALRWRNRRTLLLGCIHCTPEEER